MSPLTLIATRTSHFARKVQIVLEELELPHDLRIVADLLAADPAAYEGYPLMQVPVLIDGPDWYCDSDLIVQHLVKTRDPQDRLRIINPSSDRQRQLAVLNGIMAQEALLLLTGGDASSPAGHRYFEKIRRSMHTALTWLEERVDLESQTFDYLDVALICMWQHHLHFSLVPGTYDFPCLKARVARFAERPSIAATEAFRTSL
jgi:glutathione S-transferase